MLIRTQDRRNLVDMTGMTIRACTEDANAKGKYRVLAYSNHCNTNSYELLGVYTSNEKVLKVLDMMQDEYENANVCYTHYGFVKNKVFNMPDDEEV